MSLINEKFHLKYFNFYVRHSRDFNSKGQILKFKYLKRFYIIYVIQAIRKSQTA